MGKPLSKGTERNREMRKNHFAKILLGCLLCLLIAGDDFSAGKTFANKVPSIEKNFCEKSDKSPLDPIEYVLGKLKNYDLVMIGERHWTHEQPVFIQNLIKRCYDTNAIDIVFLEFGNFEDQGKINTFLGSPEYDPKPVIEVLRKSSDFGFGWGYQEYFDIFKMIYFENKKRPESEKIKIVAADGPPSTINMSQALYQCFDGSSLSETEKWQKVRWLQEGISGRDSFMAEVIAVYLFNGNRKKGIYYAGSAHIRKDLRKKNYGLHLFSTGGILARKYPGCVCCLTFHRQPTSWQNESDFNYLEQLFKSHGKPFALDSCDTRIAHLKLKSNTLPQGVALQESFDGYIMLNLNKNYHPCSFIPGFYNDDFAKVIWDILREKGVLEQLPAEFEKFKTKTPTGEELMKMMKKGLH